MGIVRVYVQTRDEGACGLGGADLLMVPNEGENNEASPCGLRTHTNTCTNKDKCSKDQRRSKTAFWSTDVLGLDVFMTFFAHMNYGYINETCSIKI